MGPIRKKKKKQALKEKKRWMKKEAEEDDFSLSVGKYYTNQRTTWGELEPYTLIGCERPLQWLHDQRSHAKLHEKPSLQVEHEQ